MDDKSSAWTETSVGQETTECEQRWMSYRISHGKELDSLSDRLHPWVTGAKLNNLSLSTLHETQMVRAMAESLLVRIGL